MSPGSHSCCAKDWVLLDEINLAPQDWCLPKQVGTLSSHPSRDTGHSGGLECVAGPSARGHGVLLMSIESFPYNHDDHLTATHWCV